MSLAGCCITQKDKKDLIFGLLYRKTELKCTKGIIGVYSERDPELYKDDLIHAEEEFAQNELAYDVVQELEVCADINTTDKIWVCDCCFAADVKNELEKTMVERVEYYKDLKEMAYYRTDHVEKDYAKRLDNYISDHELLLNKVKSLDVCR